MAEGPRAYLLPNLRRGRSSPAKAGRRKTSPYSVTRRSFTLVGVEPAAASARVLDDGTGWLLERRSCRPRSRSRSSSPPRRRSPRSGYRRAVRVARAPGLEPLPRRLRLLGRPRLAVELLRARRLQAQSKLPEVTIHGDFHPGNVLLADGAAWRCGLGAGRAWPCRARLDALLGDARPPTRPRAPVRAAAEPWRRARARPLRYAIAVRLAADKLVHPRSLNRDPAAHLRCCLPAGAQAGRGSSDHVLAEQPPDGREGQRSLALWRRAAAAQGAQAG